MADNQSNVNPEDLMDSLDISDAYMGYCLMVYGKKPAQLLPSQHKETKRAFFAGASYLFRYLTEQLQGASHDEINATLLHMNTQLMSYWKNQVKKNGKF